MESYKSKYKPSYPSKYKGDFTNIICRSSWERKFYRWCDLNENILQWGSESFTYHTSPQLTGEFTNTSDFIIKVRESSGEIKTYVIEVKPKKQTKPPAKRKKVSQSYIYECKTWEVNKAKWKAATEFCADRRIEFKIITEDELGIK